MAAVTRKAVKIRFRDYNGTVGWVLLHQVYAKRLTDTLRNYWQNHGFQIIEEGYPDETEIQNTTGQHMQALIRMTRNYYTPKTEINKLHRKLTRR